MKANERINFFFDQRVENFYLAYHYPAMLSVNVAVLTFRNRSVVEKPDSLATECAANGDGAAWKFSFNLNQCSIAQAAVGNADANGVKWYTYSVYLNYDNTIDASLGTGNLQQLDQVAVKIVGKKQIDFNNKIIFFWFFFCLKFYFDFLTAQLDTRTMSRSSQPTRECNCNCCIGFGRFSP